MHKNLGTGPNGLRLLQEKFIKDGRPVRKKSTSPMERPSLLKHKRFYMTHHPLPHFKIGGKILVKRDDFDQWIAGHRITGPANDLSDLVESIVTEVQAPQRRT
jgi:hypothetical protein